MKGAPGTRMRSGTGFGGRGAVRGVLVAGPGFFGARGEAGVWLRARTRAGWSAWREVEQAADGPDATSREYRPGRVYSDGQWLDTGTTEVQVRVDPPATADAKAAGKAGAAGSGASGSLGPAGGLEAHLTTPDMASTPGTEPARAGVATAATVQPRIVSGSGWGADERIRRAEPDYSDTVKAAFVHHTVQSNGYSPSESAALVRADYLYTCAPGAGTTSATTSWSTATAACSRAVTAGSPGPCSAPTPAVQHQHHRGRPARDLHHQPADLAHAGRP